MFVQNVVLLALIYSYNRTPASRRLAATTMAVGFVTAVVTGTLVDRQPCKHCAAAAASITSSR
jgi:hypothetical protein